MQEGRKATRHLAKPLPTHPTPPIAGNYTSYECVPDLTKGKGECCSVAATWHERHQQVQFSPAAASQPAQRITACTGTAPSARPLLPKSCRCLPFHPYHTLRLSRY